jgi:hypothetical protein
LRPGGRLAFLHTTPLAGTMTTSFRRPHFGLGRTEWPAEEGVEYQFAHGDWVALPGASGFHVERLVELQAGAGAKTHPCYDHVPADWARQWPCEEIWVTRKS